MSTAMTTTAETAEGLSTVLRMDDLRVSAVGGSEILLGISLELYRGQILGLVGESGSGKTTAGLACMGHYRTGLQHTAGGIELFPRDGDPFYLESLSTEQTRELRGSRVAYIPQDPALSLNPAIRVGEQIREVLDVHAFGKSSAERSARVKEVLEDVGLPGTDEYQRRWPHQLSGGQQQRIGIAMAFAMFPDVLILDEPTTGLDVSTQAHVLDTIRDMTRRHDVASLYITHDLAVVAELADRVAVMLRGELVEEGPAQQVLHRPQHDYTKRLLAAVPDLAGRKDLTGGAGLAGSADQAGRTDQAGGTEPASEAARTEVTGPTPATEASATEAAEPYLLQVSDLAMKFGDNVVLSSIDMTLEPGESTMILGESGSGKTTLSRCITGLVDGYTGSVKYRGEELAKSTRKRTVDHRQEIQYVFQSPFSSLNPRRTIGESLTVPLEMSKRLPRSEHKKAVEEALDAVRLGRSFYDRRPGDLSGGERQRAAIARALVNAPRVLVCDEITSALDVSVQASIVSLLNTLREERGLAILFVTHNITLARHVSGHINVLNKGVIVDRGTVEDVLENPSHEYTKSLLSDIPQL
ncbi:peptide/nickel transport system ATP-binding protein [Brevibacterium sp. Mu109]|uniref:ABC transporter ATP-binding protein n=1 Tax=Brevibacterium sp. Mu109 TaxID=1255669 RepID=UPI000C604BFB|nr:ABC transporter ATP-binding protein [Brevibacterium sp. Mu109]SMX71710.1 peptide/nickel transport system ATP-binding protein [Brevibacterium sp. Mu109]